MTMGAGQLDIHTSDIGGSGQEGTCNSISCPTIMLDAYNGEPSTHWDQWITHFDSVDGINQ